MAAMKRDLQQDRWTWRMSLPMPWGKYLEPSSGPVSLLTLPLAFTQNALLSPEDFIKQADRRGVKIRTEHLHELHRRRALVPLLRITQRPVSSGFVVQVPASAAAGYNQYRSPIALVIAAAQQGYLMDPGPAPFRRWDGGLPLRTWGSRIHRYPSVFYSPYQLLALRPVRGLIDAMTCSRTASGDIRCTLDPLTPDEASALNGCRQLAVSLSALDMRYLPEILRVAHFASEWEKEDIGFSARSRLEFLGLAPEALAATATSLLDQASFRDPLGPWYDLIRQADPSSWSQFRGDALLAMDYRIAAEILLRTLDDVGRSDLSAPPPRAGRMGKSSLDDRLRPEPDQLDEALAERGLSPRPALLLVLEGDTEMEMMPRVLAEIYGKPVPPSLIEPVNMKTITRDLDLLVRHEAGPRLGAEHGDVVLLTRTPTRVLVAVDPENKFATRAQQRAERDKLVRRLHESLPQRMRSPRVLRQMGALVQVVTWGTVPWEFANFTNAELATAITQCVALPPGMTRRDLIAALEAERNLRHTTQSRSPNVEMICRSWPDKFHKTELAEKLWPVLKAKVHRDAASGKRPRVPATRVAVHALHMALEVKGRNIALRL